MRAGAALRWVLEPCLWFFAAIGLVETSTNLVNMALDRRDREAVIHHARDRQPTAHCYRPDGGTSVCCAEPESPGRLTCYRYE